MMMIRNADEAPFRQLNEGGEMWTAFRLICSPLLIGVVGDASSVDSVNEEEMEAQVGGYTLYTKSTASFTR